MFSPKRFTNWTNLGLRHELLSEWYDIDTANDLERVQSQRMNSEVALKNTLLY
jgi:hypothetical protein